MFANTPLKKEGDGKVTRSPFLRLTKDVKNVKSFDCKIHILFLGIEQQ